MAIAVLQTNSAVGSDAGTPKTVTVPLTSLSGSETCIVMCVTLRSTLGTGINVTATWNGVSMGPAVVKESAALNGFGSGQSYIFALATGTISGLSANAVATVTTGGDANNGIGATAIAYSGVDQTTPLNSTAQSNVIGASTTLTESVTSDPMNRVVGCVTFAEHAAAAAASPGSGQTKVTGINNQTIGTGDPYSHVVGEELASPGSSTAGNWNSFNSSWAYTMASFVESGAPAPPVILNVDGGSYIDPNESNYTINGTDFDPPGTTAVYYADDSDFGTATLVAQTISSVTSMSINWDTFNPGAIGEGDNFLFVVTDEGGGSEAISPAFPILAAEPDAQGTRLVYECTGSESGPTLVVPVSFDNPSAAVIRATGNTTDNTLEADAVLTFCLVDKLTSMGMSMGSTGNPDSHQREQVMGTGSLIVHDGGSGPHLVEGTPSLSAAGLSIDFTLCTAGVTLEILVFGGNSVRASVNQVQISDGALTGLSFRPDIILGTSVGIPFGGPGDSSFAILSFGSCIDPGTPQQFSVSTDQSGTTRNSVLKSGTLLGQLQGTAFTWEMAITAFTADGFTWSGSNSDGAYILSLRIPGRQIFLDTFTKTSDATPGVTQQLPDFGFEPGALFISTTARVGQSPATALGGRFSLGAVTADGQDVAMAQCLPPTGTLTAEQLENNQNCVAVSSTPGTITVRGTMVDFAQISTIEWTVNSVGSDIELGLIAFDTAGLDDDGAEVVGEFQF